MSHVYGRDPVTAISEAEATGRTAEIFADIRDVMQIPLITSIWRTLVAIDDGLETVWLATRPIYETGHPDAALQELKQVGRFPVPAQLPTQLMNRTGVEDLDEVLNVVEAYNRSNGMNLIALSALVSEPTGEPSDYPQVGPRAPWPVVRPLLERHEIDQETWALLEQIKWLGATNDSPSIATLWRHLAHWPHLLDVGVKFYEPLQVNGTINRASERLKEISKQHAIGISHFKPSTDEIPPEAWAMVLRYTAGVSRMVTIGHGFALWLRGVKQDGN